MGERKSLIIVGGGLTGLSAGLTWALNTDARRKPVCLLEKAAVSGGNVATYFHHGYWFDTCQMISNLVSVFSYFSLNLDLIEFQGNLGRVCLADPARQCAKVIELPAGEEAFKQRVCDLYPFEADGFIKFFNYSKAMFRELYNLKYAPTPWEKMLIPLTCPKIARHAGETFEQYLTHFYVDHPEIRELLRFFTAWCGWPESRVAALLPISAMFSMLEKVFRPSGPFAGLPQQMEVRFRELGGELRLNSEVEKILVDRGRVRGVRLRSGEILQSECVLTTVDIQHAMQDLVGLEVLESANAGYADTIRKIRMTPSALTIHLGLDEGLDFDLLNCDRGYTVLTTGGDTLEHLFEAAARNETAYTENCFHLGVICQSGVRKDKPVLTISAFPMPLGEWAIWRKTDPELYRLRKKQWGDFFIGLVERYLIPDLRQHIEAKDISAPATYARHIGSPSGAIFGMAAEPDNFGLNRMPLKTPIRGLYQPKFGPGIFHAIMGGMQMADFLLGRKILYGNSRF